MAKKVRRVRRNRSSDRTEEGATESPATEQLREEYAYVLKDLRRVFILAAIMFTLLIVLNLVL